MPSLCSVQLEKWNWLFFARQHWKTPREATRTCNISQHTVREVRQYCADCAKTLSVNRNRGRLLSRKYRRQRADIIHDMLGRPFCIEHSKQLRPGQTSNFKIEPRTYQLCRHRAVCLGSSESQRVKAKGIQTIAISAVQRVIQRQTGSPLCVFFAPRRSKLVSWHCLKCTRQKNAIYRLQIFTACLCGVRLGVSVYR